MKQLFFEVLALAQRDITKFSREKGRVAAAMAFPFVFLAIFATSLEAGIKPELIGYNYLEFVFSGLLLQSIFQSSFMGIISLVSDREKDFSMSIFVSPAARTSIVLGKILGEVLIGLVQVLGIIIIGILLGVNFTLLELLSTFPLLVLAGFVGGSFGVLIASQLGSTESAQRVFPFFMFPLMFLSGAFTPVGNLTLPLKILRLMNPLYYGVDLIRHWLYRARPELTLLTANHWWFDLTCFVLFGIISLGIGGWLFAHKEGNR